MLFSCFFQALLASIDERPWKTLAKRRVQHYGYEFCYEVCHMINKNQPAPVAYRHTHNKNESLHFFHYNIFDDCSVNASHI